MMLEALILKIERGTRNAINRATTLVDGSRRVHKARVGPHAETMRTDWRRLATLVTSTDEAGRRTLVMLDKCPRPTMFAPSHHLTIRATARTPDDV